MNGMDNYIKAKIRGDCCAFIVNFIFVASLV